MDDAIGNATLTTNGHVLGVAAALTADTRAIAAQLVAAHAARLERHLRAYAAWPDTETAIDRTACSAVPDRGEALAAPGGVVVRGGSPVRSRATPSQGTDAQPRSWLVVAQGVVVDVVPEELVDTGGKDRLVNLRAMAGTARGRRFLSASAQHRERQEHLEPWRPRGRAEERWTLLATVAE
jgi:hypothetical protein